MCNYKNVAPDGALALLFQILLPKCRISDALKPCKGDILVIPYPELRFTGFFKSGTFKMRCYGKPTQALRGILFLFLHQYDSAYTISLFIIL
jgi:hypothetical protein